VKRKQLLFVIFLIFIPLIFFGNDSPFGINAHSGSNEILAKVKDSGIKWIRIDLYWSQIEKEKGKFDYSEIDRIVKYSRENQLAILGVLSSSPGWSNNNKGRNYPPDNLEYWRNFVSVTVSRYKNDIQYWNIWNEPNVKNFFALGKDIFVDEIFLPAAETIRKYSPLSLIAGPELAHLVNQGSEWYFWMKYILTECSEYIDIVSHHIYKNTGVYAIFESLVIGENITPSVKEIIYDSGFSSVPFWITETGWDTELFSEEEQGNRYLEFLQEMKKRNYPDKIFFYKIMDDATPEIRPWGILKSDFTEKPAYGIYTDYISGLYPAGDDSEPEEFSKKCYMEESVSRSGLKNKARVLANLRKARDFVRIFPFMDNLISLYYSSGSVLKKIAVNIPAFRKHSLEAAAIIDYIFEIRSFEISRFIAGLKP